jgi:hypothetical protein
MLKSYAHPMLEPLNYDLDPDSASAIYQGDMLKVYSLLWYASVAALTEGPVVRKHSLEANITCLTHPSILIFIAHWAEILEPGWANFLPKEDLNLSENKYIYANNNQQITDLVPAYDPESLQSKQLDNNICSQIKFDHPKNWLFEVKNIGKTQFTFSELIEQMAKNNVARPSTYANRLDASIKHGLIIERDSHLHVTFFGNKILSKISNLPSEEQLNMLICAELEEGLGIIESDPTKAGEILNKFCNQIFGKSTKLSEWVDNLVIEDGSTENLSTQEIAKIQKSPPIVSNSNSLNNDDKLLDTILIAENIKNSIQYTKSKWDDYTFESKIRGTKFKGRLYARNANPGTISNEKIFHEHLVDYQNIINYCFMQTIPSIESVEFIDFEVLTSRTQGVLYLEKLIIIYPDWSEECLGHIQHEDFESIKNRLRGKLEQYDLFDSAYLHSIMGENDIQIKTRSN